LLVGHARIESFGEVVLQGEQVFLIIEKALFIKDPLSCENRNEEVVMDGILKVVIQQLEAVSICGYII